MNIELIVLLFLLFITGIFCFTREEAKAHWDDCLSERKIDTVGLEDLKNRKSFDYDCFRACVMRKRGSINNGQIDAEKFVSTLKEFGLLTRTRTEDKFQRCAAVANKEPNECAVARSLLDCFFNM